MTIDPDRAKVRVRVARKVGLGVAAVVALVAAACVAPPSEPFVRFPPTSDPLPVTSAEPDIAGPLRIKGRDLVDAHGRRVLMHGMNLVAKGAPYYPRLGVDLTDADFDAMRDGGFNAVRLGVWYRELLPEPGVINEEYLDHVEQVVDALAAHHVWVLLDFHQDVFTGMPDWATTAKAAALSDEPPWFLTFIGWAAGYMSPRSLRQWDDLWADKPTATDPSRTMFSALADGAVAMAERFRSDPSVIGMELMNEPFAGSRVLDCLTTGCGALEARMASRWQYMTDRIHAVAPDFNVFWSPHAMAPHYANTVMPAPAVPTDESPRNVGFSFHTYCYGTDGGSLEPASVLDQARCKGMFEASLRRADRLSGRWDAPMMMTEFGASENPLDATLATRMADKYRTSWFYWHMRYHGPEEVMTQIERTSPQSTAGVPLSLSFDPASAAFGYRYRPDPSATAPTTIFVPARHYPQGYTATVSGASITSAANAGMLTVVADPGVTEVVVTVVRS